MCGGTERKPRRPRLVVDRVGSCRDRPAREEENVNTNRWRSVRLFASLAATLALAGCPPADRCEGTGSCPTGTACTSSADCASGLCAPLSPGGSSVCLAACGPSQPCPVGQSCNRIGAGSYCELGVGIDGGLPIDAGGADAPLVPDAGPVDGDGDGILSSQDCDDADGAVGRSATRACASMCGTGTETCTDGIWAPCSAPTDCACSSAGSTRIVPCGFCGMQSQTCDGTTWRDMGACLYQGECSAGRSEVEATPRCGERQRLCDGECYWLEWVQTAPDGECASGTCFCGLGEDDRWRCRADCSREPFMICDATIPCSEW